MTATVESGVGIEKVNGRVNVGRAACVVGVGLWLASVTGGCGDSVRSNSGPAPPWEAANPIRPVPSPPLGVEQFLADMKDPPTPERVRLGRWLFYDTRLSSDGTIACANCHRPENAFSEPLPVSVGVRGQKGVRKAPTFINQAVTLYPHFFWDGRAGSLEDQALGPIANPIEMGNTAEAMVAGLSRLTGYAPYFEQAFGTPEVTKERVAKALADYERTRMSGNSPVDRWRLNHDEAAVSDDVKLGYQLFYDKAQCSQCHVGSTFSDSKFHNLGIGWNPRTRTFADEGRAKVTKADVDRGAFKTPTLRELTRRGPYLHDGSMATLREVVEHYNRGGTKNPYLSPKITPLGLTPAEVDALVAFMEALDGEGYQDVAPTLFPQ